MSSPAAVPASPREPEALALDTCIAQLPYRLAWHVDQLRQRPDGQRGGRIFIEVHVNPHGVATHAEIVPPREVVR